MANSFDSRRFVVRPFEYDATRCPGGFTFVFCGPGLVEGSVLALGVVPGTMVM